MIKIVSIGDIHGRDLWLEAINGVQYNIDDLDYVVFVGDYVDSFDISAAIQLYNLQQIIELKKKYPEKVILLLGNHDMQYLFHPKNRCSGYQENNYLQYMMLFKENRHLFAAAHQIKNYLWTHAGIHRGWYNECVKKYCEAHPDMTLADVINHDFDRESHWLFSVGYLRGGSSQVGGPFWLDRTNSWNKPVKGYHQIFGHTHTGPDRGVMHRDIDDDTSVTCIDTLENGSIFHYHEI